MSRTREVEERAARWVLLREEPSWSPADEEELSRWLAQSDSHKAAFWRLDHGWREADRIASLGNGGPIPEKPMAGRERWVRPLALAASLALVVFLFMLQAPDLPLGRERIQEARVETALGGHKSVSLPDGSRVELNTSSAIRAVLGAEGRKVWLERGEAFFDVETDAGREFVVLAGPRSVTVLGTKFSVRRRGDDLVVAVLEGRVRVDQKGTGAAARSATLTPGDVAVAGDRTMLVTSGSVDSVEEQLAWRDGLLVFGDTTLAEAAEQFNRYNRKQLVIANDAAARTRIGGSFQARNVEAFARLLSDAYGLKVEVTEKAIVVAA